MAIFILFVIESLFTGNFTSLLFKKYGNLASGCIGAICSSQPIFMIFCVGILYVTRESCLKFCAVNCITVEIIMKNHKSEQPIIWALYVIVN